LSMPVMKDLRAAAAAAPSLKPAAPAFDDLSMFPLAGKSVLLGWASTQEDSMAAVAHWKKVLAAAGLRPGTAQWENGYYTLPYESKDGRVVRRFDADPRQFAPKDEAALEADKALILAALSKAGLKTVAAPTSRIDG